MNGEIPNQTPKRKKGLIFEIFFVVIVLILVFGALNYFNILRLSEIFPQLGFLPHKSFQQSQQLNNVAIKQLKISCPSVKEFCGKGKSVIIDGKYFGWGDKLASGSAIYAAFDGSLSTTSASYVARDKNNQLKQRTYFIINLTNKELGLKAIYLLRGKLTKTGLAKKGEQIAIANGNKFSIYDNHSLIFSLIQGHPISNNPTNLTQENFE